MSHDFERARVASSQRLQITVYGTAQSAGSKRAFRNKYSGRIQVVDSNKKADSWKDKVEQAAGLAMDERPLFDGPLVVAFTFYMPRPKGHYGKTGLRSSAPLRPAVRPDLLKLARAVEDALTGVVYRDDAQIVEERLSKRYGEPARVEISCWPMFLGLKTLTSDEGA